MTHPQRWRDTIEAALAMRTLTAGTFALAETYDPSSLLGRSSGQDRLILEGTAWARITCATIDPDYPRMRRGGY